MRRVAVPVDAPVKAMQTFVNAVAQAATVKHPALVPIYGVAEHDEMNAGEIGAEREDADAVLVVSEDVHGVAVRDVISGKARRVGAGKGVDGAGAFEPVEAVKVAAEASSGLLALHDAGLTHGDLSSSTVVLRNGVGGEALLAAYGLSLPAAEMERAAAMDRPGGLSGSVWLSASGASVGAGAFQYTPPEAGETVASGGASTSFGSLGPGTPEALALAKKADVYAMALVFYEIFTGMRPWRGMSMMQVHMAVVERRERPPWPPGADIDPDVIALVEQMWAHEPSARPDAGEVSRKLQTVLARVSGGTVAGGGASASGSRLFGSTGVDDMNVMVVSGISTGGLVEKDAGPAQTPDEKPPVEHADWLSGTTIPGSSSQVEDLTRTIGSGGDLFDPDEHRIEEHALSDAELASVASPMPDPAARASSAARSIAAASSASSAGGSGRGIVNARMRMFQPGEGEETKSSDSVATPASGSADRAKPSTSASAQAELFVESSVSTPNSPERRAASQGDTSDTVAGDALPSAPSDVFPPTPESLSTSSMTDTEAARAHRAASRAPPSFPLSSAAAGATSTHVRTVPSPPAAPKLEDRADRPPGTAVAMRPLIPPGGKAGSSSVSPVKQETTLPPDSSSPRKGLDQIALMTTVEWDAYKPPLVDMLASGVRRQERDLRRRESDGADADSIYGSGDTTGSLQGVIVSERTKERRRAKRLQELIEESGLMRLNEAMGGSPLDAGSIPPQRRRQIRSRSKVEATVPSEAQKAVDLIQSSAGKADAAGVVAQMKAHPESVVVARAGSKALLTLGSDEFAFYDACEEGAIDELCGAVARHGDDEQVVVSFCQAITAFSEWFDNRIGHVIRALGVPATVVGVMDSHCSSLPVQTEGCRALSAICGTSEMNRTVCASLRGMFALHKAMSRNLVDWKDVELAKASLTAFQSIAKNNEEAAEALLKVCALDTVSRAAEVFGNEDIEEDVLSTLESVAFYKKGRDQLIQAHGVHAISTIMLRNQTPLFSKRCFKFVTSICEVRELPCEAELLDSAIVERIIVALRSPAVTGPGIAGSINSSRLARETAYEGAQAVGFLGSFGEELQNQCRLVGAIETIFQVLNAHMPNAKCAKMCVRAFIFLLEKNETSIAHARSIGIVNVLHAARETHGEDERVVSEVDLALRILAPPSGPSAPAPRRRNRRDRQRDAEEHGSTRGIGPGRSHAVDGPLEANRRPMSSRHPNAEQPPVVPSPRPPRRKDRPEGREPNRQRRETPASPSLVQSLFQFPGRRRRNT